MSESRLMIQRQRDKTIFTTVMGESTVCYRFIPSSSRTITCPIVLLCEDLVQPLVQCSEQMLASCT